jgi:hypothetical protein
MLDGRLMVQWRRNSNNSMDKTPWAAFMESKDKFHNFELAALLKSKAAPTAVARAEVPVGRIKRAASTAPSLPNQYRRRPEAARPLASALPTPDLIGQA